MGTKSNELCSNDALTLVAFMLQKQHANSVSCDPNGFPFCEIHYGQYALWLRCLSNSHHSGEHERQIEIEACTLFLLFPPDIHFAHIVRARARSRTHFVRASIVSRSLAMVVMGNARAVTSSKC